MVNELADRSTWSPRSLFTPVGDPLEDTLMRLVDHLRTAVFTQISAIGLTPPQCLALRHIAEDGPVPMRRIADLLGCDASYVTNLADQLEQNGYIARHTEPGDRRVKLLAVTASGRTALTVLTAGIAAHLPGTDNLTDRERAQLVRLMNKILPEPPLTP